MPQFYNIFFKYYRYEYPLLKLGTTCVNVMMIVYAIYKI